MSRAVLMRGGKNRGKYKVYTSPTKYKYMTAPNLAHRLKMLKGARDSERLIEEIAPTHGCWIANDNCDLSALCLQCASCIVHCEDPANHMIQWGEEGTLDYFENSERVKRGGKKQKEFRKKCSARRWTAVRGNAIATYLLRPDWIRRKRGRAKLLFAGPAVTRIARVVRRMSTASALKRLMRSRALALEGRYSRYLLVRGIPDFIVLPRAVRRPFWVEVKSGESRLSRHQSEMKKYLENLGFRVEVWRGGPLPDET